MRHIVAVLLVGAVSAPLPVLAQEATTTGYRAIAAGDFVGAARLLEAERRIYPSRPELMLNLAAAYRQLGRTADARTLYNDVLARRDVAMDMPSGAVDSSHAVAQRGLSMLPQSIATR